MQIAILGTGAVGPALGKALSAAGHQVTIGTRDPDQTKARDELTWTCPSRRTRTMANQVMVNPRGLADNSTIFVAGNDATARQTAASIAADLGWTDVFDLGDLTAARGLEMYLPLWVRIFGQLGSPEFNIKLVR